ncbi:MAG: nucleotidyltransferase family protein [Bacteroidota bacterium]
MKHTGIMILAAGASLRLGRAKQLLPFQNKTLVQHIATEAMSTKAAAVVVVTGANAEEISAVLAESPIDLAYNENWRQGMGSSIRTGLAFLQNLPHTLQSVIICVCDQPFVTTGLFEQLVGKKRETGKGIIACAYAGTLGTPVLFDGIYFEQLQTLEVTDGAKCLVNKYPGDVASVSFTSGQIDIDTEEDYNNLLLQKNDSIYKR